MAYRQCPIQALSAYLFRTDWCMFWTKAVLGGLALYAVMSLPGVGNNPGFGAGYDRGYDSALLPVKSWGTKVLMPSLEERGISRPRWALGPYGQCRTLWKDQ